LKDDNFRLDLSENKDNPSYAQLTA